MDEICRFLVLQQPNSNLPLKYAALMRKFDSVTPDEFDDLVEDIVDEIEQEEVKLKKQEVMFGVIERDQEYYASLIEKTNTQIQAALKETTLLESQLLHERQLKEYKVQFEELASQVNKFSPQQDSIAKIKACEDEAAELTAKS